MFLLLLLSCNIFCVQFFPRISSIDSYDPTYDTFQQSLVEKKDRNDSDDEFSDLSDDKLEEYLTESKKKKKEETHKKTKKDDFLDNESEDESFDKKYDDKKYDEKKYDDKKYDDKKYDEEKMFYNKKNNEKNKSYFNNNFNEKNSFSNNKYDEEKAFLNNKYSDKTKNEENEKNMMQTLDELIRNVKRDDFYEESEDNISGKTEKMKRNSFLNLEDNDKINYLQNQSYAFDQGEMKKLNKQKKNFFIKSRPIQFGQVVPNFAFHSSNQLEADSNEKNEPIRSITEGKINTSKKNLNKILKRELGDVSADLSNKVEQAIGNVSRQTPQNFNEIIIIKKRILTNGKRKVVNLNVREKLVPKEKEIDNSIKDFGMRALIGGVLFLIAGLVFTSSLKMYQGYIKRRFIKTKDNDKKIMEFNR
ncbi:hypothetical protein GVAV_001976 [Gurleya vavrai]